MKKFGDWRGLTNMLINAPRRYKHEIEKEMGNVARKVQKSMVTGITSKRFNLAENAPSTIKRKKSSTPLVDKGDLVGSIATKKVDGGYFVGAFRTAVNSEGKKLANIFAIVTYGISSEKDGKRVKMPARDAITPALKENEQEFIEAGKKVITNIMQL